MNFFKAEWSTIGEEVMGFINEFHQNSRLPKVITSSFLTLIPKVKNPKLLKEFHLICLIGSLYKILAKVLAHRLKGQLVSVISNNQTTFIPSRQILDGIVVLNEVVDYATKNKKKCLLRKLDFERAYDTVNWEFLAKTLTDMNFHPKWVKWMRACISGSSMSILVNGSPTSEFRMEKGLQQGDPFAPFLFTIVVEGLARMVGKAEALGIFRGFELVSGVG